MCHVMTRLVAVELEVRDRAAAERVEPVEMTCHVRISPLNHYKVTVVCSRRQSAWNPQQVVME